MTCKQGKKKPLTAWAYSGFFDGQRNYSGGMRSFWPG